MATFIPRTPGPTVGVNDLPGFRQTAQADYSGIAEQGRALQQIAGAGFALAKRIQDKNDTTAIMQARRELSEWETTTFDPGNAEGIGKYRGKDALSADEQLGGQLDAKLSEITGRLSPRQQRQFAAVADTFREGVRGRINTHMDREHSQFLETEQNAAQQVILADATAAGVAGDFERQDAIATEAIAMWRLRMQTDGAGDQTVIAGERAIASKIRLDTILGIVGADPLKAQEYFDRHESQLLPADRRAAAETIRPFVEDGQARALFDSIMSGSGVSASANVATNVDQLIVGIESGGKADAKNPDSTATGAGQFLKGTWLEVMRKHRPDLTRGKSDDEILAMRTDGALSREMVTRYREDNAQFLRSRGIAPTVVNLYAAHHFGPGGGVKFARASDNTPMTAILSAEEISANAYLRDKKTGRPKTVGEVKANWSRRGVSDSADGDALPAAIPESKADALELASRITDPRMRSRVLSMVSDHYQIQEMREREAAKENLSAIYTKLASATNPAAPLREILGPDLYAYAAQSGDLVTYENMRSSLIKGQFIQDDPVLVEQLRRTALVDPQSFRATNLYAMADRISTDSLKELLGMQDKANNPSERNDWATTQERIDSGLRILQFDEANDPANKSEKKNRERMRAQFGALYRGYERDFMQKNQRKPSPEESDAMLRSAVRYVAENPESRLNSASAVEGYNAAMPQTERAAIVRAFRAKMGRNPSDSEVVKIYERARQQGTGTAQ